MNLKKIGLNAAVAAATLASATFAVSPAEAISFGSSLNIQLAGEVKDASSNGVVFKDAFALVDEADGEFSGYEGTQAQIYNLSVSGLAAGPYKLFTLAKPTLPTIDFFLSAVSIDTSSPSTFNAYLKGFFTDGTPAGVDTSYIIAFDGGKGGGDLAVTAVPTPALLPGLVGMGLLALRKRKGEVSEEA